MSNTCVFCGAPASKKIVFPDTFTAYQLLQAGDQACSRCAEMFKEAKFRRNCWVMQGTEWRKIDDVLGFLTAMPEPPFVLYLTLQKRKHGWIIAVQNPVLCKDKFVLVVDEDKILFERNRFNDFHAFSKALLNRGIPKGVLLCGMPNPSSLRKFGLTWQEAKKLEQLKGNMFWMVCVKFGKTAN